MEYNLKCPYCESQYGSPDPSKHLYYNTDKNVYYCFRCQSKGKGKPKTYNSQERTVVKKQPWRFPKHALRLSDVFDGEGLIRDAAFDYLRSHHLNPRKVATKYRLLLEGEYIIFPVYEKDEVIFWQKRSVFTKSFFNPPVEKKPLFWTGETGPFFIVESFLNAVKMSVFGSACCLFGKSLSEDHAESIAARCKSVTLVLDSGEDLAFFIMSRQLRRFGVNSINRVDLPRGDVCDYSNEALSFLLSNTVRC